MTKPCQQNKNAQTTVEYVIVIGIVITVFIAMTPLIKRSTQGMIKLAADQIGQQNAADQEFTKESGHLDDVYSGIRANIDKETVDQLGLTSYLYEDTIQIDSTTLSNLGFTEAPPQ